MLYYSVTDHTTITLISSDLDYNATTLITSDLDHTITLTASDLNNTHLNHCR